VKGGKRFDTGLSKGERANGASRRARRGEKNGMTKKALRNNLKKINNKG